MLISNFVCCSMALALLVLLMFLECTVCDEAIYIVSSSKGICPSTPCLTLSEFTEDASSNLNLGTNTTVLFLSGNHHLKNQTLHIENTQAFRLRAYDNTSNVNVSCRGVTDNVYFDIYNVGLVEIQGLEFIGCKTVFSSVRSISVSNSMFSFSKSSALVFIQTTSTVTESIFRFNGGGIHHQPIFGLLQRVGGAIVLNRSDISIVASVFNENTAEIGGAIFADGQNHISITNSIFSRNSALCSPSSHDRRSCFGGVLYANYSTVVIKLCLFQNNSARGTKPNFKFQKSARGGTLCVTLCSSIFIQKSNFVHNWAGERGGVVESQGSNITSNGNKFLYNHAHNGGVMYATNDFSAQQTDILSEFYDRESKFSHNRADDFGGVLVNYRGKVTLSNSMLSNNTATLGGVVYTKRSTLLINISQIVDNFADKGGAIFGIGININICNSQFSGNMAQIGAVMYLSYLSDYTNLRVVVTDSKFSDNLAFDGDGGVIHFANKFTDPLSKALIRNTTFFRNIADSKELGDGGVLFGNNINIEIDGCLFTNNMANRRGGVISVERSHVDLKGSTLYNNSAVDGGVLYAELTHLSLLLCTFELNHASVGAVMLISLQSFVRFEDMKVKSNVAEVASILYLTDCNGAFIGLNNTFADNVGSLLIYNSFINFTKHSFVEFTNCTSTLESSRAQFQEGGAVTAFQSHIRIHGECIFLGNSAQHGGAVSATESKIHVYGMLTIERNTASESGGGILLQQSDFHCESSSITKVTDNYGQEKGGGFRIISSSVRLDFLETNNGLIHEYYYTGSRLELNRNYAKHGGGMFLESSANIYILKKEIRQSLKNKDTPFVCSVHALTFTDNAADYGAAIYVADGTNFAMCDGSTKSPSTSTECFLQVLLLNKPTREEVCISSYARFENNTASDSGGTLYGGLLDRCTVSIYADIYGNLSPEQTNRVSYFSEINDKELSSAAVRVCFCTADGESDCSYEPPPKRIEKGRKFSMSIVAVDSVNHTLSNVTIQTTLLSKSGGLGEDQISQYTNLNGSCTELHFEVYSLNEQEELILFADGPCKDAIPSQKRFKIHFTPCKCPVGFQPKLSQPTRCECECDSKLDKYISGCNPLTAELVRRGNSWIAWIKTSQNATKSSDNYHYLIYPNCPLDYCQPPSVTVMYSLITPNGMDAQCANGHSGKLCGACNPSLSLSLGSSHCVPCRSHWPAVMCGLIIAAIVSGAVLIAIIMTLKMNVATGTFNGLIFYANVVNANASIFLPFPKSNILVVFIAWLNLELGYEGCFFDGMDAYWKTLLYLVFPLYLITLVLLIIYISEHYTWFARLFEGKDPVAALATLILLSYVKLIQVIITTFSFSILKYPNNDTFEVVWLPDATVGYLQGKHIALFIIAFLILIIGVLFTAILSSWQWLISSKFKLVKCIVKYHKLHMLMDTYHAPYTFQTRYWTGLLLLVRAVLYISSAVNVSRDPKVNILITAVAMCALLLLYIYLKRNVYRKWQLNLLELSCYVNLLLFCLAKFFTLAGNHEQTVIAYISVSFSVLLFAIICAYHFYVKIIPKARLILLRLRKYRKRNRDCARLHEVANIASDCCSNTHCDITYSEITRPIYYDDDNGSSTELNLQTANYGIDDSECHT